MPAPLFRSPTMHSGDAASKPPKGVDPEVWRLADALYLSARRLPYATAEARLLDGVHRWVVLTAKQAGAERLTSTGGQWAACLAVVAAAARLASPEARTLLAPWTSQVAGVGGGAPGAAGVSPAADVAAAFAALGVQP